MVDELVNIFCHELRRSGYRRVQGSGSVVLLCPGDMILFPTESNVHRVHFCHDLEICHASRSNRCLRDPFTIGREVLGIAISQHRVIC